MEDMAFSLAIDPAAGAKEKMLRAIFEVPALDVKCAALLPMPHLIWMPG